MCAPTASHCCSVGPRLRLAGLCGRKDGAKDALSIVSDALSFCGASLSLKNLALSRFSVCYMGAQNNQTQHQHVPTFEAGEAKIRRISAQHDSTTKFKIAATAHAAWCSFKCQHATRCPCFPPCFRINDLGCSDAPSHDTYTPLKLLNSYSNSFQAICQH